MLSSAAADVCIQDPGLSQRLDESERDPPSPAASEDDAEQASHSAAIDNAGHLQSGVGYKPLQAPNRCRIPLKVVLAVGHAHRCVVRISLRAAANPPLGRSGSRRRLVSPAVNSFQKS